MSPDPAAPERAPDSASIEATWTYTRAELNASQALAYNVRGVYGSDFVHPFYFRYIVVVLCILAGLAAWLVGAVPDLRNPTVPLLCAAVYYIAKPIEDAILNRYARQCYQDDIDDVLRRSCTIRLDAKGFVLSGTRARYAVEWPAVKRVQDAKGLLLFWLYTRSAIFVPKRAFSPGDLARARALADHGVAKRGD